MTCPTPGSPRARAPADPAAQEPAALRRSVDVPLPPAEAFDLFTREIGAWWPRADRPLGGDLTLEPRKGGRLIERRSNGTRAVWAQVVAVQHGHRLALRWVRDAKDEEEEDRVEVLFAAAGAGTRVTVIHILRAESARAARSFSPWATALPLAQRYAMRLLCVPA